MAEKVTIMVLKVDLQCPCCYKKVRKILCKFPQIRDQIYNEKENKVRITVVCCDPEKVRDKLCCKGAKVIKSIEIVDPPKPEKPQDVVTEEPKKPKKKVTFADPLELPEKPKENPPPEKPKDAPKPEPQKQSAPAPAPTPPPPEPIMGPGPCGYQPVFPARTCCGQCSQGYGGGPCYFGYEVAAPPPQQPCYDGYYGYGNHNRPCHVTRCDYYLSEESLFNHVMCTCSFCCYIV